MSADPQQWCRENSGVDSVDDEWCTEVILHHSFAGKSESAGLHSRRSSLWGQNSDINILALKIKFGIQNKT